MGARRRVHRGRGLRWRSGLGALAALGWALPAWGAPITFNTALPVAQGEFVVRGQAFYRKASDDPSPADRDLDVVGGIAVLGYGVTGDLALFGALPYLDKSLDLTTPAGRRVSRGPSGIGDARLLGRYTVLRDNVPGRTFRIAPFAGIEVPTGDDDHADGQGELPAPLQLGSGSWDPFFGIVATWQTLDYQIDSQIGYQVNTEANGFEFGDVARFDASLQYRLWPRELSGGGGVPGFLYAVLETNLIRQAKNRVEGDNDPSSGGISWFLDPGLQYVTRRWILEAVVQVPVVQDLNGDALKDDFIVRGGFRFNF